MKSQTLLTIAGEYKTVECYSVSVNHDGTRLALGGLDGNVRIWDTATITPFAKLDESDNTRKSKRNKTAELTPEQLEQKLTSSKELPPENLRRPMCSMSRHNGVVTTVKFSPNGQYLALGSDDKICLIWEKDEEQRPAQFGEEADLEHWQVRKRLVAHDNDIQDIAWSPDGDLLVTVGLDRSIIIWNATNFERIKRYDIHQSMVKGVVFDPAGKFFATASDDRSVRIFRYYYKSNESSFEFQMEHLVLDPFKKSPLTSYFRRLSWSPDGQHIAVPNATNGPVPSLAVINRGDWTSEVSLIGHEAPCEVTSFSPALFDSSLAKDKTPVFSTVLATGGQDRSLALWSTALTRPLLVADQISENLITDMAWSPDGQTLYFSSLDGTITCVIFEEGELGRVVSPETVAEQLRRYGADRRLDVFPESVNQLRLEELAEEDSVQPAARPLVATPKAVKSATKTNAAVPVSTKLTLEQLKNQAVTTKNGKKRVAPLLVSSSGNANSGFISQTATRNKVIAAKISNPNYMLPRLGVASAVQGIRLRESIRVQKGNGLDGDNDNDDMALEEVPQVLEATLKRQRQKLKRSYMELRYPSALKSVSNLPPIVFMNQAVMNHDVETMLGTMSNSDARPLVELTSTTMDIDEDVGFAIVVNLFQHKKDDELITTTVEVRNGQPWTQYDDDNIDLIKNDTVDFNDPTRVIVSNNQNKDDRELILFYPQRIQQVIPVIINESFEYLVLVSLLGTVWFVSGKLGSALCPPIELGANVVVRRVAGNRVLLVTSTGLMYSYRFENGVQAELKGVSLAPILNGKFAQYDDQQKKPLVMVLSAVKMLEMNDDGFVFVVLDNLGDLFQYNADLNVWTKLMDSFYYLATLEEDTKGNELLKALRAQYDFHAKRNHTYRYKFDTPASETLKSLMTERFHEACKNIH